MRSSALLFAVALLAPVFANAQDNPASAESAEQAPAAADSSTPQTPSAAPTAPQPVQPAQPAPPVAAQPPPVAAQPPPVAAQPPPVAAQPPPVAAQPPPVAAQPPPVAAQPPPVVPRLQYGPSSAYGFPAQAPAPGTFTPSDSPLLYGGSYTGPAVPPYSSSYTAPPVPPPQPSTPRYYTQPDASPYVLPPLPPGYMYMPMPAQGSAQKDDPAATSSAVRDQAYAELQQVDARLFTLKQQRIGIGGPIVLMVLGFGSTLVGGLVGLTAFGEAERIQHDDYNPRWDLDELDANNDGRINGHDAHRFRRTARVAGGVAGAGLLLGIIGARRLASRKEQRRERAGEMRQLTQKRELLRSQLGLSPSFSAGRYGSNYGVNLTGHF